MRSWPALVLALVLLTLAALVGVASRGTPDPRPLDAPAGEFSAGRAAAALAPVASTPRVAGTPAHARARDHLVRELRGLGLDASVVSGIGHVHLPGRNIGLTAAGRVDSILATRAGTDPTGTVVLATHYDTVPGSPGAADAGIGIATILEVARAVGAGATGRNDLAVLITDGEESGLLGAQAFARDHSGRLRAPVVVINHEARGGAGRPLTIRTAGRMTAPLHRTPRPEVESATEAMFALAPNNTDFSIFTEAGWRGVDTATIGDAWSYHTPADDLTRLDPGSLQHMGDSTLALTLDLLGTDLAQIDREPEGLPTTVPWGLLAFPPWAVTPAAALSFLLVIVAIGWRRARGQLTVLGTLAGTILSLLIIVMAGLGATASWEIARAFDPGRASTVVGEPGVPLPYLVAQLCAAVAVFAVVQRWTRRRPGATALAHGGLLLVTGLTLTGAVLLPGVVTWLLVPVLAAAVGLVATVPLARTRALAALTLALLPAAWTAGGQLSGMFDNGVGQGAPVIGALAGLVLVLVAAPILGAAAASRVDASASRPGGEDTPVPRSPGERGRRRPSRARAVAAGAAFAAAVVVVPVAATGVAMAIDSAPQVPRQETAGVRVDPAAATATWDTSTRTAWGAAQDGRVVPADPAAFPPPGLAVISDRADEERRHLRLRLTSARRAPNVRLDVTGGRLAAVNVSGVPAPSPAGSALLLSGLTGEPVEVSLTLADLQGDLVLELTDHTHELTAAPGYAPPPAGVLLVAPEVSVTTRLDLPVTPR